MNFYIDNNENAYEVSMRFRKGEIKSYEKKRLYYIGRFQTEQIAKEAIKEMKIEISKNKKIPPEELIIKLKEQYKKRKTIKRNTRKFLTTGIYVDLKSGSYGVQIKNNRVNRNLGRFDNIESAIEMRKIAEEYKNKKLFEKWYSKNKDILLTRKAHQNVPTLIKI